MRIWNGLRLDDIIEYKGKRYIITKLYEEKNTRVCDLTSYDKNNQEILKGVSVYECSRIF